MTAECRLRIALAGIAGFAACYLAPSALLLPLPVFDPFHGRWFLADAVSGLQIRYFGDLLWGTGGAIGWAAIALVCPRAGPFDATSATCRAFCLVALDVAHALSQAFAPV